MSVLIKGEMPLGCDFCELYDKEREWCRGAKKEVPYSLADIRADFCPLVPVPPHGRLIDADAFIESERRLYCADCDRRKGIRDGEVRIVHDIGDAPCLNCYTHNTLCDVEAFPAAEL